MRTVGSPEAVESRRRVPRLRWTTGLGTGMHDDAMTVSRRSRGTQRAPAMASISGFVVLPILAILLIGSDTPNISADADLDS